MDDQYDEGRHDRFVQRRPKTRLQQSPYVQQYIRNVKELFNSIDSYIKHEVVNPRSTKLEKEQLTFTLGQVKEQVLRQIVRSVQDHKDYGQTEPVIIPRQGFKKNPME